MKKPFPNQKKSFFLSFLYLYDSQENQSLFHYVILY